MAFTNYSKEGDHLVLFDWVGLKNFMAIFDSSSVIGKQFGSVLLWTLIWAFFATFTTFFGGVFLGCGTGLIIKGHATSGGTDIIAMLLTRYTRMRFSRAILLVDSCIIVFGMVVLGDWRLPLYSLITIFVSSRIIDYIIDGPSYDKLLFIISDRQDEIREFILDKMDRGGTYIKSTGMYTAQQRDMIFLVVSRNEVSMLQNMIHQIDPASFVVIVDAYETYGDGFKAFPEKK